MKLKFLLIASLILTIFSATIFARDTAELNNQDRIRIAEAYRIADKLQDQLWVNWDKAPLAILLVTDDYEFLIRHPKPSDEFESNGYDKLLKSEIFVRPRKFSKNLLATFPAFGRTPVIVIGQAENTFVKTSTPWVFTVLHEHFHQLQMSQPTYFTEVEALNLSHGDQTGMWQLNFPFPYKDREISEKFTTLSNLLLDVYNASNSSEKNKTLDQYLIARADLAAAVKAENYKYFSFQLWQEGIARYTEYKMAELASRKLKPSAAFRNLKDYTPYRQAADALLANILSGAKDINFAESERVAFYPFGSLEGLLLDKVNPKWRQKYLTEKFALENFYPKTINIKSDDKTK